MTMLPDDDRVDLAPIARDADVRAARIASRVAERVAAARRPGVVDYLARFAAPALLAAAAGIVAVVATRPQGASRPPGPSGDVMARLVAGGPVSLAELMAVPQEDR